MIYSTTINKITITVADHVTDDFQSLMNAARDEGATEYSNLEIGDKYGHCVVLSYNNTPYGFFLMGNDGRYAPEVLRVFTKLYTAPKFRSSADINSLLIPGDTATGVMYASHSVLANFVEDVLPMTGIKPYSFYFYSRAPGDTTIVSLMNKFAKVKWTAIDDRIFLIGRKETDPRGWKHIVYKGDLSKFTQPSKFI